MPVHMESRDVHCVFTVRPGTLARAAELVGAHEEECRYSGMVTQCDECPPYLFADYGEDGPAVEVVYDTEIGECVIAFGILGECGGWLYREVSFDGRDLFRPFSFCHENVRYVIELVEREIRFDRKEELNEREDGV